ncbi:adenylosuccinate lyase, partial [Rhizobium leguminosarum]|nr:adenylosuccinate lyase [Rhizobium ruizarguesonis]
MAAVRAGVGRETAHEVIKEHAVAMALDMRETGAEQNLIERLARDERLPLDRAGLDAALADRHAFIGAAESQVDGVLARIQLLIDAHPSAASYTPGEIL